MASNNENRGVNIYLNANAADDTLKQLKASATRLRNELALLPRGSEEFAEKSKILDQVKDRLKSLRDEAEGTRESFFNLKEEIKDLAKLAIGATIGGSLLDVAKNIISQNKELSDSYAGVMKTTGLTEVQVEAVNRSLQKIDTRTAKSELLGLAQVAGKLGLSTVEDVEGFVRSADKIGVALGEDLGGTEQAVNELGKLLDIFKVKQQFGIEDALLKVGSAINDLGASGTANEKNLIDFSTRLAGIAPAAKISLPNVLGMAAVMDELGQSMQTSSTAIGQFIVGMGNDVPKYAKIAGMEVQDFANLLRDDANSAMMRVLDASKNTGGGIAELAKNMKELDVTGSEGRAAIGALANNIDMLREKQEDAAQSFKDGTSITNEFNTANNNLAANIDKLANKFATMWENSGTRAVLTSITAALVDNRSESQKLKDELEQLGVRNENLDKQLHPLLSTYDQLKSKGTLNKDEQIKLKETVQQLALVIPEAVTEWDKYGQALDINRGKINLFNKAQKELFEAKNKDYIDKLKSDIATGLDVVDRSTKEINSIQKRQTDNIGKTGGFLSWFGLDKNSIWEYDKKSKEEFAKKWKATIYDNTKMLQSMKIDVDQRALDLVNGTDNALSPEALAEYLKAKNTPVLDVSLPKKGDAIINAPDPKKEKKSQAEKDREAAQKLYEKLVDEEKLFNAQRYQEQLAENDKEIALEQAKYDKLIEAWEGFRDKKGASEQERLEAEGRVLFLQADKESAIARLREKQEKEIYEAITKIRSDMGQKMLTELDREQIRINEHYQKLLKDAGTNEAQKAQIQEAWEREIAQSKIRERERVEKEIKVLETGTTGFVKDEHKRRIAEIEAQHDLELEKLKEKYSLEIQETELFKQAMAALDAKYQQKKDEENGKADKDRAKKIKEAAIQAAEDLSGALFQIGANNRQAELDVALSNIEKQREKELSNKNLSEAQKKAINDKYDKQARAEKLKAWKADKNASLLQAGINTALAVTKALPNIFLAAAAAAAGAAQIAVIAATKPPQFFHGGFTPGKKAEGWVNEPTLFTNSMGNQFTAGENHMPEYVVSSEQLRDPRIANFVDMMEAGRINQIGNLTAQKPVIVQNNSDTSVLESKMDLLYQAMIAMGDKKVIMLFSEFENARDTKVKIENTVNS
ncbi:phage tail tape measure protein [Sphingobacterium multivorum]|nr:phage tail tape measure protein [Sphingobacterium multivorum]QQT33040.1 phage tail tape measure protein [Sphingobacterium multivorum]